MIKISTKKFDPSCWPEGVWGAYMPGAELKVRKLSGDVLRELRKPFVHTEMEVDKKSRAMVPKEKMSAENEEKFNDALTDFLLEDHKGFGNEDGQPFPRPLDLESKKALLNDLSVNDWVWSFARAQEVIAEKKQEAEIKNSSPSPVPG
jgi:hypothetical protein